MNTLDVLLYLNKIMLNTPHVLLNQHHILLDSLFAWLLVWITFSTKQMTHICFYTQHCKPVIQFFIKCINPSSNLCNDGLVPCYSAKLYTEIKIRHISFCLYYSIIASEHCYNDSVYKTYCLCIFVLLLEE